MVDRYHRLLERQIKKYFGGQNVPDGMAPFLQAVSRSYEDADEDLKMLERSMSISSDELAGINADLNAIFQAVPDVFMKIDPDGTILDCKTGSTDELYVAETKQLIQKRIQDVPDADSRRKLSQTLEVIRETHSKVNVEYTLRIKGEERFYEARFAPLNETQYVVLIRAITEKKKRERAMEETLADLKKFKQVTVDRELRMIALKKEINQLCQERGRPQPYEELA
jgi:PAS domain S-box-containing protein